MIVFHWILVSAYHAKPKICIYFYKASSEVKRLELLSLCEYYPQRGYRQGCNHVTRVEFKVVSYSILFRGENFSYPN